MPTLDHSWAIDEIDQFLHVTGQVNPNKPGSGVLYVGTVMRGPSTEASQRAHVVEQILDRLLHRWRADRPNKDKDLQVAPRPSVSGAGYLGAIGRTRGEVGRQCADMDAANLHAWAWENEWSYWNTGHYHQESC